MLNMVKLPEGNSDGLGYSANQNQNGTHNAHGPGFRDLGLTLQYTRIVQERAGCIVDSISADFKRMRLSEIILTYPCQGPKTWEFPKISDQRWHPKISSWSTSIAMVSACHGDATTSVAASKLWHFFLHIHGYNYGVAKASSVISVHSLNRLFILPVLPDLMTGGKKRENLPRPQFLCPALARLTCHSSPKLAWQQVRAPPVMWCSLLGIMDGNGPLLLMIYLFEKVIFHRISVYQRVNSAVWVSCQFSNFCLEDCCSILDCFCKTNCPQPLASHHHAVSQGTAKKEKYKD